MNLKVEIRAMPLQAKNYQRFPANQQRLEKRPGEEAWIFLHSRRNPNLLTLWSQASSFQNCEAVKFCCSKPSSWSFATAALTNLYGCYFLFKSISGHSEVVGEVSGGGWADPWPMNRPGRPGIYSDASTPATRKNNSTWLPLQFSSSLANAILCGPPWTSCRLFICLCLCPGDMMTRGAEDH